MDSRTAGQDIDAGPNDDSEKDPLVLGDVSEHIAPAIGWPLGHTSIQWRVVLYEDDLVLARQLELAFQTQGHVVSTLTTNSQLLDCLRHKTRDLLVMDRMIDGVDMLDVVERLRRDGSRTPVIFMSSKGSVDDRISGLKAGGDDYLVKPLSIPELLARVEALMRRSIDMQETQLTVGELSMDLIRRSVTHGTRFIRLLPREFALLEFFMRRPGQVITRSMILESVWKMRDGLHTNVVDVHLSNLRRKFDSGGCLITNQRGVGFVLQGGKSRDRLA